MVNGFCLLAGQYGGVTVMLKRLVFVPLSLLCSMCGVFCGGGLLGGVEADAATIQLPQTGQTVCYDAAGSVITCNGTGQDGDKRAGVVWNGATRFTVNGDGTITDTLTGLIWLQNADCTDVLGGVDKSTGYLSWAAALTWSNNLASGHCGLTDSSTVGQWRLSNRKELKSLINRGNANNDILLESMGFTGVKGYYWSSSTYANVNTKAWYVGMYGGLMDYADKGGHAYVWPVRGGQ